MTGLRDGRVRRRGVGRRQILPHLWYEDEIVAHERDKMRVRKETGWLQADAGGGRTAITRPSKCPPAAPGELDGDPSRNGTRRNKRLPRRIDVGNPVGR